MSAPAPAPAADLAATLGENPFQFLDYFKQEDARKFAGRADAVREIVAGLTRGRTYVLYGRSGVGKTSLLLAGVFPELQQRRTRAIYLRVLESPVEDLCARLAVEAGRPSVTQAELPALLTELAGGAPLLLAFDQFEEFFIRLRDNKDERTAFARALGEIVRATPSHVRILFSLREDYYAELSDFRAELPDAGDHGHRVQPLTAYGTRQAILRPLQDAGVQYDERLVAALVDELAGFEFDPLVLQILCTEVYRAARARGSPPVRLAPDDLRQVGGIRGVFRRYIGSITRDLDADRRLLACAVLEALITGERTKRAVRPAELVADASVPDRGAARVYIRATEEELREILELLVARYIVRRVTRDDERWYELLHDRLVPVVNEWLEADEQFAQFRFAKKFVSMLSEGSPWRAGTSGLLNAGQLAERIEPWRDRLQLTFRECEFVLRSAIHAASESVGFWAAELDRFAPGLSAALVLALTAREGDVSLQKAAVRRAAAKAAGAVADPDGLLALRCFDLAFNDLDEDTRRAAGASLARIASAQVLAALVRALPIARQRAIELLADLYPYGRLPATLPHGVRSDARKLAEERRYLQNRDAIRAASTAGGIAGLLAALGWALTVGAAALFITLSICSPETVTQDWPWGLLRSEALWVGGYSVLTACFGFWSGWRIVSRSARRSALGLALTWAEKMRDPNALAPAFFVATMWSVPMFAITPPRIVNYNAPLAAVMLASGTLVGAVLGRAAAVGLEWVMSRLAPEPRRGAILWYLLCAVGPPFAAGALLGTLAAAVGARSLPGSIAMAALGMAAMVASFETLVASFAVRQYRLRPRIGPPIPVLATRSWPLRAVVLATVISLVPFTIVFVGPHGLPIWPEELDGSATPHTAALSRHWRQARYYVPPPGALVKIALDVTSSAPQNLDLFLDGTPVRIQESDAETAVYAKLPERRELLAVVAQASTDYELRVAIQPIAEQLSRLDDEMWHFAYLDTEPQVKGFDMARTLTWRIREKSLIGRVHPFPSSKSCGPQQLSVAVVGVRDSQQAPQTISVSESETGNAIRPDDVVLSQDWPAKKIKPDEDCRFPLELWGTAHERDTEPGTPFSKSLNPAVTASEPPRLHLIVGVRLDY